jgi:hypothetical protein
MNKIAFKIALIISIVTLFTITLLPMFSPVMNIVRQLIGTWMIGWWTGSLLAKISNK